MKIRTLISVAAAGSLGLFPAFAAAATDASTGAPGSTTAGAGEKTATGAPSEQDVLSKIHLANQMEVEMGQLASQRALNPNVRQYGDRLVNDHKSADDKVKTVASQAHIDLKGKDDVPGAKADDDMHQAMRKKLEALSGTAFDRAFLQAMADDHAKTIDSLSRAEKTLPDGSVKTLVTGLLPTLREHEKIAKDLLKQSAHSRAS